jgi:transcription initiation factor IIE alpha subunit
MSILLEREDVDVSDSETILAELFGRSPEVKVLDFFMDHPLNDYMQVEISERTGMNPRTIKRVLESLLSDEIIRINRKIGKATLFKLNSRSLIVKKLKELEITISLESIVE